MNVDKRLTFFLSLTFILCTIAGTLLHESGHYFMARLLGHDSTISYNYTHLLNTEKQPLTNKEYFLFTLGGPLQTILTGTIGFLFLTGSYKKSRLPDTLSLLQWFFVFLTLFWLRQIANLAVLISCYLVKGEFSHAGDEINIDDYLSLPYLSVNLITAVTGAILLSIIFFRYIPPTQRITFIVSGLLGGSLGFILWIYLLGPVLMP